MRRTCRRDVGTWKSLLNKDYYLFRVDESENDSSGCRRFWILKCVCVCVCVCVRETEW